MVVCTHFIYDIRDKVRIKAKEEWYKDLEEKEKMVNILFDEDESGHVLIV